MALRSSRLRTDSAKGLGSSCVQVDQRCCKSDHQSVFDLGRRLIFSETQYAAPMKIFMDDDLTAKTELEHFPLVEPDYYGLSAQMPFASTNHSSPEAARYFTEECGIEAEMGTVPVCSDLPSNDHVDRRNVCRPEARAGSGSIKVVPDLGGYHLGDRLMDRPLGLVLDHQTRRAAGKFLEDGGLSGTCDRFCFNPTNGRPTSSERSKSYGSDARNGYLEEQGVDFVNAMMKKSRSREREETFFFVDVQGNKASNLLRDDMVAPKGAFSGNRVERVVVATLADQHTLPEVDAGSDMITPKEAKAGRGTRIFAVNKHVEFCQVPTENAGVGDADMVGRCGSAATPSQAPLKECVFPKQVNDEPVMSPVLPLPHEARGQGSLMSQAPHVSDRLDRSCQADLQQGLEDNLNKAVPGPSNSRSELGHGCPLPSSVSKDERFFEKVQEENIEGRYHPQQPLPISPAVSSDQSCGAAACSPVYTCEGDLVDSMLRDHDVLETTKDVGSGEGGEQELHVDVVGLADGVRASAADTVHSAEMPGNDSRPIKISQRFGSNQQEVQDDDVAQPDGAVKQETGGDVNIEAADRLRTLEDGLNAPLKSSAGLDTQDGGKQTGSKGNSSVTTGVGTEKDHQCRDNVHVDSTGLPDRGEHSLGQRMSTEVGQESVEEEAISNLSEKCGETRGGHAVPPNLMEAQLSPKSSESSSFVMAESKRTEGQQQAGGRAQPSRTGRIGREIPEEDIVIIEDDDEEEDEESENDSSEYEDSADEIDGHECGSDATSRKLSDSGHHGSRRGNPSFGAPSQPSEDSDDDCQLISEVLPRGRSAAPRRVGSRISVDVGRGSDVKGSEKGSSLPTDSDCEILEGSQADIRRQWEEAVLRRRMSRVMRSEGSNVGRKAGSNVGCSGPRPNQAPPTASWQRDDVEREQHSSRHHGVRAESVATSTDSEPGKLVEGLSSHGGTGNDLGRKVGGSSGVVRRGSDSAKAVKTRLNTAVAAEDCAEVDAATGRECAVENQSASDVIGASTMACKMEEAQASVGKADAAAESLGDGVLGDREKMKETEEFKQADHVEWERRKIELLRQSSEAQRMRKRKRAEADRKLEMESRQKQRLLEIRQFQQQEEVNLGLKDELRGHIRSRLEVLAKGCGDMGALLRRLGITVEGGVACTSQQVNAAYKKALLKFHPDRASTPANGDPRNQVEAEETFKLISRMKSTLPLVAGTSRWH